MDNTGWLLILALRQLLFTLMMPCSSQRHNLCPLSVVEIMLKDTFLVQRMNTQLP